MSSAGMPHRVLASRVISPMWWWAGSGWWRMNQSRIAATGRETHRCSHSCFRGCFFGTSRFRSMASAKSCSTALSTV
nr:hypothetical protein [Streptomyces lavendulae]